MLPLRPVVCGGVWWIVRVMRGAGKEDVGEMLLSSTLLLIDALAFTRDGIDNAIGSTGNRPLVNMDIVRINAGGNTIASVGNGCALGIGPKTGLGLSCVKFASGAVGTDNGDRVILSRSGATLGRIIIMNCNAVHHGSMASSVAAIGTGSLGGKICASPTRVLRNGIPKLIMASSNSPDNSADVALHNTSSLQAKRTVRPCCIVSNVPKISVSVITPSSVRDVSILHSTSTATVCNSGTTGNIVVVAAGGNGGGRRHIGMSCSNCMNFSRVSGALSVTSTSSVQNCMGTGGLSCTCSCKTSAS